MQFRVRLAVVDGGFDDFDAVMQQRRAEADEFYDALQYGIDRCRRAPGAASGAGRHAVVEAILRFDVREWLQGDPLQPPPPASRLDGRNADWRHLINSDVSRCRTSGNTRGTPPGIWRFTASRWRMIDPEFAKDQLVLLTREWYMHPNGQLPAYEWAFGDVNPPVHAWAAWRVYEIDRGRVAARATATFSNASSTS